ncbi:hypothetical protein CCP3SC1_30015 [Gammaproteobacteria bacterium]
MDNNVIIGAAAGAIALGGLIWWFFGSSSEDGSPKSKEEIANLLTSQGYKIKEIEFDDGVYEVDAYQNGKKFEIKLDPTGKILKIEEDD